MTGDAAKNPAAQRLRWPFFVFIGFMLALTALFAMLGLWQLDRLKEKETLVASVAERLHLPPLALPPSAEWVGFDAEVFNFRPVSFAGRFVNAETLLVFTSLTDADGRYSGPGYWVMTPLALEGGGAIFVNRGFIPQQMAETFAAGGAGPEGQLTLTGIARASEEATSFTPGPDTANRIEWVRDLDRLARMVDPALAPFAPIYVDLPAGEPGALPQGGETTISFPNNHFGYALTWFGFALLTPILLAVWVFRQVVPAREPQNLR